MTPIDIWLTAGLGLFSAIFMLVLRWMLKVVGERNSLEDRILVSSIDSRLEPRFRSIEDSMRELKGEVKAMKGRAQ